MAEGSSSGSSASSVQISAKPWFLTYAESGDVFVWKNGARLKIGKESAGVVTEVFNVEPGVILVSLCSW